MRITSLSPSIKTPSKAAKTSTQRDAGARKGRSPVPEPSRRRGETPGPGRRSRRWLALFLALPLLLALAVAVLLVPNLRRPARRQPAVAPWAEQPSAEEQSLRRAVAERPRDAAAHRQLGEHYLRRGLPFEAVWELVETLALRPDDLDARLRLAAAMEATHLPDLAQELLQEPLASPEDDLARRLALARHHLRFADARAAARALEGVGERLAASPQGLLVHGRVLQANGDYAAAEAAYRRHVKQSPAAADGYYWLGRLLLESGRPADARSVLAAGRQAAPSDARFPFYLGLTFTPSETIQNPKSKIQNPNAARALFQEALRLAPDHALPHYQLGLLSARDGQWRIAGKQFDAAVKADPDYADAYRELGRALEALKRHPFDAHYRGLYFARVERPHAAVRAFRELAAARPDSAEGSLLVSRMLIQTMQYNQAVAALKPALRRFPRDPAVYERLSVLYKLVRSRAAVEKLCEQWRAAIPAASEPYWVLGKLRTADGRVEEGIQLYEKALAMEPERADYLLFLGQALAGRAADGDLPRALDLIGRSVQKAPRDAAARFQLGLLLQRLGRTEESRAQMLRALDLDPHQPPPYNSLAQIAGQLRHPASARFFARAIRLVEARVREEERVMRRVWNHPKNADAHLAAARFRRRTGALAKAKAHLEQALELRPSWPEAATELRRVRLAQEAL